MNAGKLNKRITIQQVDSTQNEYGERVETWVDKRTCFASAEPLSGREWFTAQQFASDITIRFAIRHTTDIEITPGMRLVYDSQNYDINAVINVLEQNRQIEMMCSRVTT